MAYLRKLKRWQKVVAIWIAIILMILGAIIKILDMVNDAIDGRPKSTVVTNAPPALPIRPTPRNIGRHEAPDGSIIWAQEAIIPAGSSDVIIDKRVRIRRGTNQ